MTDSTKPIAKITGQPLTTTAITPTTVLVDDTVALVDDTNTLVGSQVTPAADIRVEFKSNPLKAKVSPRR